MKISLEPVTAYRVVCENGAVMPGVYVKTSDWNGIFRIEGGGNGASGGDHAIVEGCNAELAERSLIRWLTESTPVDSIVYKASPKFLEKLMALSQKKEDAKSEDPKNEDAKKENPTPPPPVSAESASTPSS